MAVMLALRLLPPALALSALACSNVAGSLGNPGDSGTCSTNTAGAAAGDDGGDDGGSPCNPGDLDGITGGCYTFDLTVDDTGFTPIILKAENLAQVTLTLHNNGTRAHDFIVGCLPISYAGCPPQQCFPSAANIPPLQPGSSATTTFATPNPEGIYNFRSDVSGDSQLDSDGGVTGIWGQFVVQ
jgi:hypothetical protein